MKRIGLLILCFALLASLAAFAAGAKESTTGAAASGAVSAITFPLANQVTLKYIMVEHSTEGKFPYDTDYWGKPGGNFLTESTNVKLDIVQLPYGNAKEKAQLMLSTGDVGDIMYFQSTGLTDVEADVAGSQGLFVDLMKYQPLVANYLKYVDAPDTQFPSLKYKKTPAGNLYHFNWLYPDMAQRGSYIDYRMDLWRDNNLKYDTWDDLYNAFKVLKGKYPKSYPFAGFKSGDTMVLISTLAPMWRTNNAMIFDTLEKNDWMYGPIQENYKKMLTWLNNLYAEGLLHPESFTMSMEQWNKAWVTEDIFAGTYWGQGGDWFSANNPTTNPKVGTRNSGFYVWQFPAPAMTAGGLRGLNSWVISEGMGVPYVVNAKSKNFKEALAFMDFLYSKPDIWLSTTYGKKGVEWDYVNGAPQFLDKNIKIDYNPSGTVDFATYWKNKFGKKFSQPPIDALHSESNEIDITGTGALLGWKDFLSAIDGNRKAGTWPKKTQPLTQFNQADSEQVKLIRANLQTYADEMTVKFITGATPLSQWDSYVQKCKDLGADNLVSFYKKSTIK